MTEELLQAYVEASQISVPENLVEDAVRQMTEEAFHRRRYECMAVGQVISQEETEQIVEEARENASFHVKTQLVLEDIIEKEAFEVTQEELEEEAAALAERQQMRIEAVKDFLGEDLTSLKDDILIRKAIDFINGALNQ